MKIKKQERYKDIISYFERIEGEIRKQNRRGLRDINVAMEDLMCDLLNLTYDYELENLNREKMNYPGIDLGDRYNRVAVQITSESDREKIEKTIAMFDKQGYRKEYDRLIIMILGKKKKYKKEFRAKTFSFSADKDIVDMDQLLRDIDTCNTSKVERIWRLLKSEILSEEEDQEQEPETPYAREHAERVQMEAERLYGKIQKIREEYPLTDAEFRQAEHAVERIRKQGESIYSFEDEVAICRKALSFVTELTLDELRSLHDFRVVMYQSVLCGVAQSELEWLFEHYDLGRAGKESRRYIEDRFLFFEYTYEQMQRILTCCKNIMAFDPNSVLVSNGYISENIDLEHLLAVCLTEKEKNEQNKIYIWNTENMEMPAAILGGIYEQIYKIRIFKIEENILVTALGSRQIYIWNLQSETYKPISILKGRTNILDYGLYYSKNGNYYIIGRYTNWIYLWELYGDENPVRIIALEIDQFDWLIVNTRMKRQTYQTLGEESYDSFRNRKIYRLVEKDELKFAVELICDQESIIGRYCKAKDGEFSVEYYKTALKGAVLGVLTKKALFLYDMEKKQNIAVILQEGQKIHKYDIVVKDNKVYLLIYYLYIGYRDDGKGLVRYFSVDNGCVKEIGQWFRGTRDIFKAVIGTMKGKEYIFFNSWLDNKIYAVGLTDNREKLACSFPQSMELCDMEAV